MNNVLFPSPTSGVPTTLGTLTINGASENINLAWDQVNMEFGKHFDLGDTDYVRLHGGLNFSRVAVTNQSTFVGSSIPVGSVAITTYNKNNTIESSFNG